MKKNEQKHKEVKQHIISTLKEKSILKQIVYDKTKEAFKILKKELQEIVAEYDQELKDVDARVNLEYRDRGLFEAEIKVAGDIIIFNMHSNAFEFPRNHEIWKDNKYREQPDITYAGIINIYNFLSDSFKYNRMEDLGYLIGRVFVNKEGSFFIEGHRHLGFGFPSFNQNFVDKDNIRELILSSIAYVLRFDLLVPPYANVNTITVGKMREKFNKSRMQTGKRLGFEYNPIKK